MDGIHFVSAASGGLSGVWMLFTLYQQAVDGLSDVWMVFTLYQQAVDGDHFSIN